MRRPKRLTSLVLTVILMLTVAVVAVAADKETSFYDLKEIVTETEYKIN